MRCTNCGQELAPGAALCPFCGAPVASAPPPVVSPARYAPPAAAPTLPGSSGISTASLVLGILGVVSLVAVYAIYLVLLTPLISRMGGQVSPDEIQGLLGGIEVIAISALYIFSMLLALVGLILGIVGVSQEGKRPTRYGKALGIIGIALGTIPVLCCVTSLLLGIVALTGAGS